MKRLNFHSGHKVSYPDLNEVQQYMEDSDELRTHDWLGSGVASGLEIVPASGSFKVVLTSGVGYNDLGERMPLLSDVELDVSKDYLGYPTYVRPVRETREVTVKTTRVNGVTTRTKIIQGKTVTNIQEGVAIFPIDFEMEFKGAGAGYGAWVSTDQNNTYVVGVNTSGAVKLSGINVSGVQKVLAQVPNNYSDPVFRVLLSGCDSIRTFVDHALSDTIRVPVTVFLILDQSGSMVDTGTNPVTQLLYNPWTGDSTKKKLTAMKEHAIFLVNQLRDIDTIGFISFSQTLLIELIPVADKATVISRINSITGQSSTSLLKAVNRSIDIFPTLPPENKRLFILMSDGGENNSIRTLGLDYDAIFQSLGIPPYSGSGNGTADQCNALTNIITDRAKDAGAKIFCVQYTPKGDYRPDAYIDIMTQLSTQTHGAMVTDPDQTALQNFYETIRGEIEWQQPAGRTGFEEISALAYTDTDRGSPYGTGISLTGGSLDHYYSGKFPEAWFFKDNFSGTGALNSHTPDMGEGWTGDINSILADESVSSSSTPPLLLTNGATIPTSAFEDIIPVSELGVTSENLREVQAIPTGTLETVSRRIASDVIIDLDLWKDQKTNISDPNFDSLTKGELIWGLQVDLPDRSIYIKHLNEDVLTSSDGYPRDVVTTIGAKTVRKGILLISDTYGLTGDPEERIPSTVFKTTENEIVLSGERILKWVVNDVPTGNFHVTVAFNLKASNKRIITVTIDNSSYAYELITTTIEGVTGIAIKSIAQYLGIAGIKVNGAPPKPDSDVGSISASLLEEIRGTAPIFYASFFGTTASIAPINNTYALPTYNSTSTSTSGTTSTSSRSS